MFYGVFVDTVCTAWTCEVSNFSSNCNIRIFTGVIDPGQDLLTTKTSDVICY